MSASYCVFSVGDRRVGISMSSVREIVDIGNIVPVAVPLAPAFVQGLFNLRGQVLPYLDLSSFVGGQDSHSAAGDRAVVVERGDFRFATAGQAIDTVQVEESAFTPIADAALFPALDAEAQSERGAFHVIHLDRLEACLNQAMRFGDLADVPVEVEAVSSRNSELSSSAPAELAP